MKCSRGIYPFLEEISSLSHSILFLYFFALITEEGLLISSGYFPCYSLLCTWCQTTVEVKQIVVTSFKWSHACSATLMAPDPAAGHCQPMSPQETPGHSWASLGQSLVGSLLLSPRTQCTQFSVCVLQESISTVLCNFWHLYGGVNGDLFKEGPSYPSLLRREPLPLGSLLLTCISTGDTQTLFCLSLLWSRVLVCTRFDGTLTKRMLSVKYSLRVQIKLWVRLLNVLLRFQDDLK